MQPLLKLQDTSIINDLQVEVNISYNGSGSSWKISIKKAEAKRLSKSKQKLKFNTKKPFKFQQKREYH